VEEEEQINMNAWLHPIKAKVEGGLQIFIFSDQSISLELHGEAWRKRNKSI
jgi:hypothetical protein